jgi:hypothetical protein
MGDDENALEAIRIEQRRTSTHNNGHLARARLTNAAWRNPLSLLHEENPRHRRRPRRPRSRAAAARARLRGRPLRDAPHRSTEAHQTADFAELVCSNSLKSESENTAPWLLKQEMRRAGSILLAEADASAVPAGHALAVDRVEFSRRVAARIAPSRASPSTAKRSLTLDEHDPDTITILATGPLTSPAACRRAAAPHRLRPPRLLRLHLAHRRRHHHRHGQGLLRRALRQRHRRLHQLPLHQRGVRPFLDALTTAEAVPPRPGKQIPRPSTLNASQRRTSTTSKAACPSKRPPAAAATPSASAP